MEFFVRWLHSRHCKLKDRGWMLKAFDLQPNAELQAADKFAAERERHGDILPPVVAGHAESTMREHLVRG